MKTRQRVEKLRKAQDKINDAIHLIKEAVKGTSEERYYESYIIAHLDNWANTDSGTYDETIPKIINQLRKEEE